MAYVPFRAISRRYGMHHRSVERYYHDRMPAELRAAHEREKGSRNSDLIAKVRRVFAAVLRLVDEADQTHDREAKALMLKAAALVLPYAKGIGEMRGDLTPAATEVNVNMLTINYAGKTDWMAPAPVDVAAEVLPANGNGKEDDGETDD